MNNDNFLLIALEEPSPFAVEVPVLKVFDGDGFLTQLKSSGLTNSPSDHSMVELVVRFGFIDAPELEQPGGLEAKDFLTNLIGGRTVWIDILTKMDTGRSVDRYGRIVAVPYLEQHYSASMFSTLIDTPQGANSFRKSIIVTRNIELKLVANGWAWVLERYGPDDRYFEALEDARSNKRGIWAYENNIHPWTFKQQKGFKQRQSRLFTKSGINMRCPEQGCGGNLVKRNGKFGEFLGCSNYPKCRFSHSILAKRHES
jgi:endonuclease YncB( thermonuclease family)